MKVEMTEREREIEINKDTSFSCSSAINVIIHTSPKLYLPSTDTLLISYFTPVSSFPTSSAHSLLLRQSIYSSPLSPFKPRLVYKANHYIEGMAFDSTKRRLFWTGYSRNGSGVIVRFHPSRDRRSYTELIKNLYYPKALLLYPERK